VTDKELTLLAAKAFGIALAAPGDYWGWRWHDHLNGIGRVTGFQGTVQITPGDWRPLEDDGDALRLAVKLRLDIASFDSAVRVSGEGGEDCYEPGRGDLYSATRRAIVRTAAEIGRAMP
jgi:hypothetical protein